MMQKFTVKGDKLSLGVGALVGLDRQQYKDRAHNLKPSEIPGVYETLRPIEFKKDEEIEVAPEALSRADQAALGIKDKAAPVKPKKAAPKPLKAEDDPVEV